jgi:hypothetical protein
MDLFTPLEESPRVELTINTLIIGFLNRLEGWKTKCKNLHWAAPKRNIHKYLDEFLVKISDYQDSLAEEFMGIHGKLQPNAIKAISSDTLNAFDFISEVRSETLNFYVKIPQEQMYVGIKSECETFIHEINKYKYLFNLCDVTLY